MTRRPHGGSFRRRTILAALHAELRDLKAELTDGEAGLLEEVTRLRGLLASIRDCTDEACGPLCGRCVTAVQQLRVVTKAVPVTPRGDALRRTG